MKSPLRLLFKLAARLRYGRGLSHAYMWLPYLALTKPKAGVAGEISYKGNNVGRLVSAGALAKPASDTVYVIGSGPSVKNTDLSLIADRSAILLNGAISLVGNELGPPLAVAIEDERFIERYLPLLQEKIGSDIACLFSAPVLRAICEKDAGWLKDKTVALIDNVRKPYGLARPSAAELAANPAAVLAGEGRVGFSNDPDWGVFQGGSVAVSALQFAMYFRPSSIGLIGIDISNANEPRFYETHGQMAKSGVARATDRIVSHLFLARQVAETMHISVVNHSPVSVLRSSGFGYDPRLERADATDRTSTADNQTISGFRP
jgi:hypothetical protein